MLKMGGINLRYNAFDATTVFVCDAFRARARPSLVSFIQCIAILLTLPSKFIKLEFTDRSLTDWFNKIGG